MDRRARKAAVRRPAARWSACTDRRRTRTHGSRSEQARPPAVSASVTSSQPVRSAPPAKSAGNDDIKKAVDDDVAQVKEKQCADAQARYKNLIEGRKLYKAGADGERQYLTSEEIDAERLNAKRDIDTICNSPT
jgi:hypothetical protein